MIQGLKKSLALLLLSCSQLIFVMKFLTITLKKVKKVTENHYTNTRVRMLKLVDAPHHRKSGLASDLEKVEWFGELVAKLEMDEDWVFIEESQHWRGRGQVLR